MKRFLIIMNIFFGLAIFTIAENNPPSETENNAESSSLHINNTKSSKKPIDRIHLGGNLSGGFSNDYYFLIVSPRLSFELTEWFVPGVSATYMYSQETGPYRVNTNTWGVGVFTDIYPIKFVYGHIEYQHLWYNKKIKGMLPATITASDDFLLLGAGVRVPIGAKAFMFASVLFNVLNNENSAYYMYQNPIYSVGFDVGL